METQNWTTTSDLVAELERSPFAFDFFHAVRLLEAAYSDLPRIGESRYSEQDPVRFGQNPCLTFPPSTIESFHASKDVHPAVFLVRFFGLFGPNGPMPLHFTDHAARRRHESDEGDALVQFCNIFHHRLISLYYRSWSVHRKNVDFDRVDLDEAKHGANSRMGKWSGPRFPLYLASLIGQGLQSLRFRDAVSDWAKFYFAGTLSCRTRHASGLRAILKEYFEVPFEVDPFVGEWFELPEDSVCLLGGPAETCTVGESILVGDRVWECQLRFRLRVGPLGYKDFRRFLPSESGYLHLSGWLVTYLGNSLAWEAQLILKHEEIPAMRLGEDCFLGWTTWLQSDTSSNDAKDVILSSEPEEYDGWAVALRKLEKTNQIIELESPGGRAFYYVDEDSVAECATLSAGKIVKRYEITRTFTATTARFVPGELSGIPSPHRSRQLLLPADWQENVQLISERKRPHNASSPNGRQT